MNSKIIRSSTVDNFGDKPLKRLVVVFLGVFVMLLSKPCFAAHFTCAFPGASLRMDRAEDRNTLMIELRNDSSLPIEFNQWSMSDASIELSATTESGDRLRRFVPFGSPGLNRIQLQPGERHSWTYSVDDAFPDLQATLDIESVLLEWKFKLVPYGSDCSMTVTGNAHLQKSKYKE